MGTPERGLEDAPDDVQALEEIAAALRRAGLRASAEQIANATLTYRGRRGGLARLRARLSNWDPMAATFDANQGSWSDEDVR